LVVSAGFLAAAFLNGDLYISESGRLLARRTASATPSVGKKIDLKTAIKKFSSAEEFKSYLASHPDLGYGFDEAPAVDFAVSRDAMTGKAVPVMAPSAAEGGGESATRVSETNVQVAGIDEPDIVKTDGKELFVSMSGGYYPIYRATPMTEASPGMDVKASFAPPYYNQGETRLINAFPPADMKIDSKIKERGDLLVYKNTLIIFGEKYAGGKIIAYDVSDKASPKQKWTLEIGQRDNLVSARLLDGKIYLAVAENANPIRPCPFEPIILNGAKVSVACADIYYPTAATQADTVYNFFALEAENGKEVGRTSFVGASGGSVFYMSKDAAYITYQNAGDLISFAFGFFSDNKDLIPDWVIQKVGQLAGYDLNYEAKMVELNSIIDRYQNSLDENEALKARNEITNRLSDYHLKHRRELEKTGLAKIDIKNFKVTAAGEVPGNLLNQFALDESGGYLRLATTVGEAFWGLGVLGLNNGSKSANDVYVLDGDLRVVGSVKDLGETERIYSVRFIGDRGYLVTFRQTDPFYVLDLSNPRSPVVRGELKIPGYSSYLHPLGEHKVLGIGKEGSQVKLAIYDASDAANPKEVAKYILDEYWSEALNNHHAFLQDEDNKVFFMPGSQGGYVFSYADGKLAMLSAVSGVQVERAVYLDNYLYLVGQDKITVLDEKNWNKAKEFDLGWGTE